MHVVGQSLGGAVAGVYAALDGASTPASVSDSESEAQSRSLSNVSVRERVAVSSAASRSLTPAATKLVGVTMISPAVESPNETLFARAIRTGDYSWLLPNTVEEVDEAPYFAK